MARRETVVRPMRWLVVLILLPALFVFFSGCGRGERTHSITVAGSTSVQPFAEVLAEEFSKSHPLLAIDVQGGGSSAGIQAATAGAAEIGMSSRDLKKDETAVKGILIARDAIAVVVNPSNPVSAIDLSGLMRVYTGEITSWKQLGWIDKPVTVISREEGSGTRGAFDEAVMQKRGVWPGCIFQDSNGSVRQTVAQDRFAIGYISLGLVNDSMKALGLDGILPTFESASSGKYPLVRPFLFVVKSEPQGLAREFIDYVLSPAGQKILQEEGLIPANAGKAR